VIDEATEAAAKQLAAHLDCVSVERIEEELDKLLSAPKPGAYLEPEVLAFVLPELPPDDLSEAGRYSAPMPKRRPAAWPRHIRSTRRPRRRS